MDLTNSEAPIVRGTIYNRVDTVVLDSESEYETESSGPEYSASDVDRSDSEAERGLEGFEDMLEEYTQHVLQAPPPLEPWSQPGSPPIPAFQAASPSYDPPVEEEAELDYTLTSVVDSRYSRSTVLTYDPVWIKRKNRPSNPEDPDD